MADEILGDRKNALEEEFFRKQNAELMARLRSTKERTEERAQLAEATGVHDEGILNLLIDQGVTPATTAALALAPLVAVAWADRKLEDRERRAILAEAATAGVAPGTPEHELLSGWLQEEPPPTLMAAWGEYTRALMANLGPEHRRELRETLMQRAKVVANAAGGGFAGLGSKVSDEEQRTLAAIESALSG